MQQAGEKTAVGRTVIRAQIDKREAVNWRRTRLQKNTEPAGAGGGKCRENGDADVYGRACGKNTQSRNMKMSDCAGSKSSAPVNGNLAGKKPTRQSRGSGGHVANDAAPDAEDFQNAQRGVRLRVNFANREYIRSVEDACMY